jgi:hypothetical protein
LRRFLFGKGFKGAGDDLFGRAIAAGAQVGGEELLTVGIEGHVQGHASVYHAIVSHNVLYVIDHHEAWPHKGLTFFGRFCCK